MRFTSNSERKLGFLDLKIVIIYSSVSSHNLSYDKLVIIVLVALRCTVISGVLNYHIVYITHYDTDPVSKALAEIK